jgi:hypothetical protein
MKPTIVLVHGDWADASSWTGVIERLQATSMPCRQTEQWISSCAGRRTALSGLRRGLRRRRRAREGCRPCRRAAARGRRPIHRAFGASGVEDDPDVVAHRDVGPRDPTRAAGGDVRPGGAQITRVEAGHLSPITHPADVTKVILSAIDATTVNQPAEVAAIVREFRHRRSRAFGH